MFSGLENPTHWLFIAIVALIVFGPKRLPELGRSLGSGIRGFRDSLGGHSDEGETPPPAESAGITETSAPAADTRPPGA